MKKTWNVVSIAIPALCLMACAPMQPQPRAGITSSDCDTSRPGARCDVAIQTGSQYRCELGSFDVNPELLTLRGGRPANIVWTLSEPFAFCDQDSVYLKPGVTRDFTQAYETFGSDSIDGTRGPNSMVAGVCKDKWHWNWRNSGTDLYSYNIQFTDKRNGRKCTIDPWVRNG